MKTPLPDLTRKRAGWLSLLFVGEMFTATAMGYLLSAVSPLGMA